jgi:hypothetical protein
MDAEPCLVRRSSSPSLAPWHSASQIGLPGLVNLRSDQNQPTTTSKYFPQLDADITPAQPIKEVDCPLPNLNTVSMQQQDFSNSGTGETQTREPAMNTTTGPEGCITRWDSEKPQNTTEVSAPCVPVIQEKEKSDLILASMLTLDQALMAYEAENLYLANRAQLVQTTLFRPCCPALIPENKLVYDPGSCHLAGPTANAVPDQDTPLELEDPAYQLRGFESSYLERTLDELDGDLDGDGEGELLEPVALSQNWALDVAHSVKDCRSSTCDPMVMSYSCCFDSQDDNGDGLVRDCNSESESLVTLANIEGAGMVEDDAADYWPQDLDLEQFPFPTIGTTNYKSAEISYHDLDADEQGSMRRYDSLSESEDENDSSEDISTSGTSVVVSRFLQGRRLLRGLGIVRDGIKKVDTTGTEELAVARTLKNHWLPQKL